MANRTGSSSSTAANIISSLGVKGATWCIPPGTDGASFGGFVPVLGPGGKLDISFIPEGAAELSVQRLHNVVIVDPGTTATTRTGSIIAPFKTISEAAAALVIDAEAESDYTILLTPGVYDAQEDASVLFAASPKAVYIIGLGKCQLKHAATTFSGIDYGGSLTLVNICTTGNISVPNCASVTCRGVTSISGTLSTLSTSVLYLAPEAFIATTTANEVRYLSDTGRIGNSSNVADSKTASDALNRLNSRLVRVSTMTEDEDGHLVEGAAEDIPAAADSSKNLDFYDLSHHEHTLVAKINNLVDLSKNGVAETLQAKTVTADSIYAKELRINAINLGGYLLAVDAFGYLVVSDSGTPPDPPSEAILIRDSDTGIVYKIGMSDGRLYIVDEYDDQDDPGEVSTIIPIVDSETGLKYEVFMESGRLMVQPAVDEASPDPEAPDNGAE